MANRQQTEKESIKRYEASKEESRGQPKKTGGGLYKGTTMLTGRESTLGGIRIMIPRGGLPRRSNTKRYEVAKAENISWCPNAPQGYLKKKKGLEDPGVLT